MTTTRKNIAHSVFQRLLNHARTNNEDFNLLLSRYGMERFLYRLSVSAHKTRFVLKGASLFLVWKGQSYRVTRDADLLGFAGPGIEHLADVFRSLCVVECQDDGMNYLPDSLRAESIRDEQEYGGVRITLTGMLNQARIPLQIDIGFGDAITPAPEEVTYPTLLDAEPPVMYAYPRYTMVAEKLETSVKLGLANSRMKDFFDLWLVSKLFSFDGSILRDAVQNTFDRRSTQIPASTPFAFTASFHADPQKTVQWLAFVKKTKPHLPVSTLSHVIADIAFFLLPVLESIRLAIPFDRTWLPDRGWCTEVAPQ